MILKTISSALLLRMIIMGSMFVTMIYAQELEVRASDGNPGDQFGCSVSVSGADAIVGAKGAGNKAGAAYIFQHSGNTWKQLAKLTANDGSAGDNFGYAVAISGDYAIVGATGDSYKGKKTGSAYVFKRSKKNVWKQIAKLLNDDGGEGDQFGCAVDLDDRHAIVGVRNHDDKAKDGGAVFLFHRSGDNWKKEVDLSPDDDAAGELFGTSVAISGDWVVVGAVGDRYKGKQTGSAYVFQYVNNSWKQASKLVNDDGGENDQFGCSVGISGDHIIVGAINHDDKAKNGGAAFIFYRSGVNWKKESDFAPDDDAAEENFGYSVSLSGDYAIIGAVGDRYKQKQTGSAYIFKRSAEEKWIQVRKLLNTDGSDGDMFGCSVSISNGNTMIGVSGHDHKGKNSGAIYSSKNLQ